jgi:hypothetical protein
MRRETEIRTRVATDRRKQRRVTLVEGRQTEMTHENLERGHTKADLRATTRKQKRTDVDWRGAGQDAEIETYDRWKAVEQMEEELTLVDGFIEHGMRGLALVARIGRATLRKDLNVVNIVERVVDVRRKIEGHGGSVEEKHLYAMSRRGLCFKKEQLKEVIHRSRVRSLHVSMKDVGTTEAYPYSLCTQEEC